MVIHGQFPIILDQPEGQSAIVFGGRKTLKFQGGHGTVGRKNGVGRIELDATGVMLNGTIVMAFLEFEECPEELNFKRDSHTKKILEDLTLN